VNDRDQLTLADVVPLHLPPGTAAAETVARASAPGIGDDQNEPVGLERRGFLKVLVGVGVAAGLGLIGWIPYSRPAGALAPSWELAAGCNGLQYNDCSGCCCSTVCGGFWNGPCCGDYTGWLGSEVGWWHKDQGLFPGQYSLRSNECHAGAGAAQADGWTWAASNCGCGEGATKKWKCTDGLSNTGSGWLPTICMSDVKCY
jgi:hypothetical protein